MVDQDGGWTTTINARGDVEWTPPPHLDTGQARVNHYRHPRTTPAPTDDEDPSDEHHPTESDPDPPQSDAA